MRTGYKIYNVPKVYKVISLLFALYIINLSLYGQVQNKEFVRKNFKGNTKAYRSAKQSILKGDYYYGKGDHYYRYAIPYYMSAEKINPDNDVLNYKIGKCMIFSSYKDKAIAYLEQAVQLNPKLIASVHYYLARAYHLNMDWDKAKQEYTTYLQTLSPDKKAIINDVRKKIEECDNGKQLCQSPVRVFVDNMDEPLNNEYAQYHPLVTADESEMIYTYRTPILSKKIKFDARDGDEFEQLLVSYSTDGVWGNIKQVTLPISTKKTNIATAGLSPDGQTLYLYRTKDNGDIYQSHLTNNTWAKPRPMGKNINSTGKESSITISADGKTFYFVSDRPGGYGMGDIYVTTMDSKGKWSAPKNLGPVINTQYDEQGVFLSPDGNTLYFSSTGHNTMGGYDIFKSVHDSGHWSAPENMGYPINTPGDDIYFTMPANKKHAYYSSDQKGGKGNMDMYMITFLGPEKPVMVSNSPNTLSGITSNIADVLTSGVVTVESNKALLRGVVVDSNTHTPLLASIELVDNKKNKVLANFKTDSLTGEYVVSLLSGVNYGISIKADNHLFYSTNVDMTDSSHYLEIVKNIALQPIEVGSHIALRNVFFDFNKSTLRKESTNELQEIIDLLKQYPSVMVEIAGYTDNKGTDKYNLNLSAARAKSVVTYLQTHGISAKRLTSKGYGSANPIATNTTDDGRQLNRRTEFKITGK
jgi:outer membrane protein OmpA-like peptidoglycan-associated protein